MKLLLPLLAAGLSLAQIEVTWEDDKSIKSAASTIAFGLAKFYTGNNTGDTPGYLPDPYYWWEAGGMFGAFVDYWWATGDESYVDITMGALTHQGGKNRDYMSENETLSEGNDDQGFWAMAAMSAAERKFPDPPDDQPQWLALVQAVFNQYVSRWDTKHCDGGMRWQINSWNAGWDYKNSVSNGCFFNIASRLARFTGNDTYSEWAEKVWDWEYDMGLITDKQEVLDGVHFYENGKCPKDLVDIQWTYNAGIFLYGAASMYNMTESDKWKKRVDGIFADIKKKFVKNNVLWEAFCEPHEQCNQDQQSFKGYLSRWLAATAQIVPYTYTEISKLLMATAQKAVATCTGTPDPQAFKGHPGTACGFSWVNGKFDNKVGVASQMNAMQVVSYTLLEKASVPFTTKTGGTSKGDVNGGYTGGRDRESEPTYRDITTGDKAGAGIVTALLVAGCIAGTAFLTIG